MQKIFSTLTVLVFLSVLFFNQSCTKKKNKTEKDTIESSNISLVMGNPIDYGKTNLLIFPVGGNYNPEITERTNLRAAENLDTFSSTNSNVIGGSMFFSKNASTRYDYKASDEYTNSDEESFDIRNLLFYDQQTRQSYLLALQNLHILSFSIHHEFTKPLIFYRVVKKDINKDKKFNSSDAVMFCVSDMDGKNLVEVTPQDEQFLEYFYYPKNQTILIKSSFDIDGNGRFTLADETNFREMKLTAPAPGKEIFTKALKDSIKSILK